MQKTFLLGNNIIWFASVPVHTEPVSHSLIWILLVHQLNFKVSFLLSTLGLKCSPSNRQQSHSSSKLPVDSKGCGHGVWLPVEQSVKHSGISLRKQRCGKWSTEGWRLTWSQMERRVQTDTKKGSGESCGGGWNGNKKEIKGKCHTRQSGMISSPTWNYSSKIFAGIASWFWLFQPYKSEFLCINSNCFPWNFKWNSDHKCF